VAATRPPDTATLLASEIITNAVIHAATPVIVNVCVAVDRHELVVAVTDFKDRPVLNPIPPFVLPTLLAEPDPGRGVRLEADDRGESGTRAMALRARDRR
jgi:anti-sigma regulatory factor (Ser/Thr protein kinase)